MRYRGRVDAGHERQSRGRRDRSRAKPEDRRGRDRAHYFLTTRPFQDIRDFKRLVREDDALLARNIARQLTVYATGAPVSFGDRAEIERIVPRTSARHY